jgi:hypothetical protein
MKIMEFRKGSFCLFRPILCQEGYCHRCFIFSNRSSCTEVAPATQTKMVTHSTIMASETTALVN